MDASKPLISSIVYYIVISVCYLKGVLVRLEIPVNGDPIIIVRLLVTTVGLNKNIKPIYPCLHRERILIVANYGLSLFTQGTYFNYYSLSV